MEVYACIEFNGLYIYIYEAIFSLMKNLKK